MQDQVIEEPAVGEMWHCRLGLTVDPVKIIGKVDGPGQALGEYLVEAPNTKNHVFQVTRSMLLKRIEAAAQPQSLAGWMPTFTGGNTDVIYGLAIALAVFAIGLRLFLPRKGPRHASS